MRSLRFCAFLVLFCAAGVMAASAGPAAAPDLRLVVIVSRHGVRSPTDPNELATFAARPWPTWEVAPGYLTPHGATLMTYFGASYRAFYAAAGLVPADGCPPSNSVYVWADVDQRTKATAQALLDGFAPHCSLVASDIGKAVDPLFHALPAVGKGDSDLALAAIRGSLGADPQAVVSANSLAFAKLDSILGCSSGGCERISAVPMALRTSPKSGLTSVEGAVDLASTAVEDFVLAFADGKPASDVGWGAVDRETLLALSSLHTLKFALNTEPPYVARVQGSNLLAHVLATIDQGASGTRNDGTRAPLGARFVAFVGHDTNLEELAGMLHLRWIVPGYQFNDTPPGGALVFEVYRPAAGGEPFVRTFFTAQKLDDMRSLSNNAPERVPVFVPGCPGLDCPAQAFDRIVGNALDRSFVASW
jgi:4-phytase/acid phosphatase